ncbi:MAG: hypothetical protein M3539_08975 [Acidobacteriota bacterium]|nr:hypothetical protein [Acidobacteriota bacterium]
MTRSLVYFQLLLALFLGVAPPTSAQKHGNFVLGFADCEPAVFTELVAPMKVTMTNITYMPTNRIAGFRLEVVNAAGQRDAVTVKIDEKKWKGQCDSLAYTAEGANGLKSSPPYNSFEPSHIRGMVAFSPTDPGGVILGGSDPLEGDMTTRLKYADSGRRLLDTQSFVLRGTSYVITYSEYNYGRMQLEKYGTVTNLLGYSASIAVKK